ncbi:MAG TPA: hypothetical protein P5248_06755, partial [Bacteroidales bacterium]|nr:hypothetical protein [Bacteroidales bacterium]
MKKILPLIYLCFLASVCLALPQRLWSQGVVRLEVTAFGKPAERAVLRWGEGSARSTVPADPSGRFVITLPEAGSYPLSISMEGCRTYEAVMEAALPLTQPLNYSLALLPRITGLSDKDPRGAEERLEVIGGAVKATDLPMPVNEAGTSLSGLRKLVEDRLEQFRAKERHFRTAADKSFAEGSTASARESYRLASTSWPESLRSAYSDEAYYTRMIAECDASMQRNQKLNADFDLAVRTADQFFKEGDFSSAEKVYRQALTFKPNAPHPTRQLEAIAQALQAAEANRMMVDVLLASAEKWEKEGNLGQAIADLEQAGLFMPGDATLEKRIEALKVRSQARDKEYTGLIASADRLRDGRNYEEALAAYRSARKLKPQEAYPMEQIRHITDIFQGDGGTAEYDGHVQQADRHFEAGRWREAEAAYGRALTAKPGDEYALRRRDEASRLYREEARSRERFEKLIAEGDEDMALGNATDAVTSYTLALQVIPGDKQATDKLSIAEELLRAQQGRSERLSALIRDARLALGKKDAAGARTLINEARVLAPEDKEVGRLLADLGALESTQAREEAQFRQLLDKASQAANERRYAEAIGHYRAALGMRPGDAGIPGKIAAIEDLVARQDIQTRRAGLMVEAARLAAMGSLDEAIAAYREAQALEDGEDVRSGLESAMKAQSEADAKAKAYASAMARGNAAMDE